MVAVMQRINEIERADAEIDDLDIDRQSAAGETLGEGDPEAGRRP